MKPTRLRSIQRAVGWLLAGVVVLLVANSAFLVTNHALAGLVAPMQAAHVWLGWLLSVLLVPFVGSHVWLHRRHRNAPARTVGVAVASLAAGGCIVGGVLGSMNGGPGARGLRLLHEGAFAVAMATYLLHRLRARVTPALRGEWIAALAVVVLVGGTWALQVWLPTEVDTQPRPTFEPGLSNARLRDGHQLSPKDLADPGYCAECHPSVAARWTSSAHRHSSLTNPFYRATLELGQAHRSAEQMKFCGGCHDPQLLLTGRMDTHPTPDTPGADEGITCLACHAIEAIDSRVGNASYRIAPVEHYPGFGTQDADARALGARLIRTKPEQHRRSMAPEHLRRADACLPCHKAHVPAALNETRWLAGQNDYDPWFDSGAGGQSARTFFPPAPEPKRCQDCHMPRIESDDPAARGGTVADHAFPGANTALPTALGDAAWAKRSAEFLREVLTVDIGAVEVAQTRVLTPSSAVAVPAGSAATVDVVVRNVGAGHLFPGGIADLREVWLEATLTSDDGETLLVSGWVDPDGNVDPNAHRWNTVLLTPEGDLVTLHDVERASVVLTTRRIMLGASDVVRLELTGPAQPATLTARVLHRKFPQRYVDFVLGEDAPAMPVVVMGEASMSFVPGEPKAAVPSRDAGPRLRNLGIGHLLRGDTALAREAATAAAARMPDDPGPPMDLARAALADGALEDALAHIRAADRIEPGHPTAAWLLARVRFAQGDHPAAADALAVAREAFPRDRELLAMEANILFKLERDDQAAERLETLLKIDPEHLTAHALLTRIRAAQGDEEAAATHEQAWNRVRPASADQTATERARREHPALDRRANQQYVLPLSTPTPGTRQAAP